MSKIDEENLRKIQKVKRSYYVTLPISYVRTFGWDKNRNVVIKRAGRKLFIERVKIKPKSKKTELP